MTRLRVLPVARTAEIPIRSRSRFAAQFHIAARMSLRREPSDLFTQNALVGKPK
jgi:hypothetical protein